MPRAGDVSRLAGGLAALVLLSVLLSDGGLRASVADEEPAVDFYDEIEESQKRFVLLASPRTGSTLVCSVMSAFPGVHCANELLVPDAATSLLGVNVLGAPNKDALMDELRGRWDLLRQVLDIGTRPLGDYERRKQALPSAIVGIENATHPQLFDEPAWRAANITGFKVMFVQILPAVRDKFFDYCERRHVRIVRVVRRSFLDTIASHELAKSTHVWRVAGNASAPASTERVALKPDAVLRLVRMYSEEVRKIRAAVAKRPRTRMHVVYYEDFVGERRRREIEGLLAFLDLPASTDVVDGVLARFAASGEARDRAVSLEPCYKRYKNWPEIKQALLEAHLDETVEWCEQRTPVEL